MNYTNKPVIPLIDAAATSLLNNDYPVLGGALAHCVGKLQRINEAAHALASSRLADQPEALAKLQAELRWLGPLP